MGFQVPPPVCNMIDMDIVIAGAGQVGRHVAEVLVEDGHNITIVDVDVRALRRLGEDLDVRTLPGSATRTDSWDCSRLPIQSSLVRMPPLGGTTSSTGSNALDVRVTIRLSPALTSTWKAPEAAPRLGSEAASSPA